MLLCNKMQLLREELESVQSEKDQLSASMKDVIQGAESYKVGRTLYLQKMVNCQKNTLLLSPSLDICYLLAQVCLVKEIMPVQLSTPIKKCKVLVKEPCIYCQKKTRQFFSPG